MTDTGRIFFGSLEAKERERLEGKAARPSVPSPPEGGGGESLPFSAAAAESQEKHAAMLHRLELHRRARQIVVPTNDDLVKLKLREIHEPIILFGEKPEDRRERLREHLAKLGITDGFPAGVKESSSNKVKREEKESEEAEAYLTEGTAELKAARMWVASYSVPRAKGRIAASKRAQETAAQRPGQRQRGVARQAASFARFVNTTSEIGDERPLAAIRIAPNSRTVATGAWSGMCKLWELSDAGATCRHSASLRGHSERIHDIAFHPHAHRSLSPHSANLATCASDRSARLWALSDPSPPHSDPSSGPSANGSSSDPAGDSISYLAPLATLDGHEDRVNGVGFHPSGRYLGTCSSDRTWRFWDIETSKELFYQEGHSRAIHAIAFQKDGSLVATGGEDNAVRVWDLRSGRPLWSFVGHVKQVVDLDWAPNGYHIASASDDHSVRIWDLRKRRNVYVLAAHSSLISTVRYQNGPDNNGEGGDFLLTAAFDNTCKIWNTSDWSPVKTLAGHEGRIMSADISADSKYIVSAAYDRTWKLWCDEDGELGDDGRGGAMETD